MERFNIYQSANSDKETIKKSFIVRQTEFRTITDTLSRHSAEDPVQHELIFGRRGSGKTTLLKRIEIEIEENLNTKYIPINLAEEQASVYRLSDLWIAVIEEIKNRFSFQPEIKAYSEFNKEEDYTRYLYRQIHEFCLTRQKQIVLLSDNFDRIVESFHDDDNLFSEVLINYNDIVIIAASAKVDERSWWYDKFFYELFRVHYPGALTIDEMKELFNHWAEIADLPELKKFVAKNSGKLQSIRIITDGLPRTLQFFIQAVVQNDYANEGVDYLKMIMDNVTPIYQERLIKLPPQLRKTVLEMAFVWEACNTKELVERCRMESKLISANLITLAEKGVVDKIETDKRNLLYRISDRFFNMWLIMTQGNPEQKRKANRLNIFLENWYNVTDLKERISQKALEFANAAKNENDEPDSFDLGTIYRVQTVYSEAEKYFLSAIEKGKVGAIYNLGNLYVSQGKYAEAEMYYLSAIEKGHISATYNLGLLYANQGKPEEAEKYFLSAAEKGQISAMYNLGNLYVSQGKYAEAEMYYLSAIEKGHISAMYNLGNLYAGQGKPEEAEKYYRSAAEKGHGNAMYNMGLLYYTRDQYAEAETCYLSVLEKGYENVVYNLGLLYANQGKYAEAEKYYLSAIERNDNNAFYNLAALYYHRNVNKAEALKYIRQYEGSEDLRIIIELWNGIFNNPEERTLAIIKEESDISYWFIVHLLIHQQKVWVPDLFTHSEVGQMLQEKLKVLHYVCLLLNKKTEKNLRLRIPLEIQTTIDGVINYIAEKEKFYKY